jgi:hypothetical protein
VQASSPGAYDDRLQRQRPMNVANDRHSNGSAFWPASGSPCWSRKADSGRGICRAFALVALGRRGSIRWPLFASTTPSSPQQVRQVHQSSLCFCFCLFFTSLFNTHNHYRAWCSSSIIIYTKKQHTPPEQTDPTLHLIRQICPPPIFNQIHLSPVDIQNSETTNSNVTTLYLLIPINKLFQLQILLC